MTNLPDQHIGYDSSFELKLYNKGGQNTISTWVEGENEKDNMGSSLPAFNKLQLSFPQLEAKTHWGGKLNQNATHKLGANIIQNKNANRRTEGEET